MLTSSSSPSLGAAHAPAAASSAPKTARQVRIRRDDSISLERKREETTPGGGEGC